MQKNLSSKAFFCTLLMTILLAQVKPSKNTWTMTPLSKTPDNISSVSASSSPLTNKTCPSFLKSVTSSTKSSPLISGKPQSSQKSRPEFPKISLKTIIQTITQQESMKSTRQKQGVMTMTMSFEASKRKLRSERIKRLIALFCLIFVSFYISLKFYLFLEIMCVILIF